MELLFPSYYHAFQCLGGSCPDSCCQEWDVQIDPKTAHCYRALPGALGADIRRFMKEEDGDVYLENQGGRCPMWREDGLCRIQAELGEEALSHVCREFPRLRQDYGSFVELGLEMSCPEAARIMLTCEAWTLEHTTLPDGEDPDYDADIMAILQQTRPAAFALLQDKQYTVNERLALLLMYGYHVQALLDGAETADFVPEAALTEARGFAGAGTSLLDFYRTLEILTERWRTLLDEGAKTPVWHEALCRFAEYGVYRYYYQAVSDWDLAARIKMIVAGCIAVALLVGEDTNALISTVQLYAKEIENDAENIDALLDGAYTESALSDANLLGLLLL